MPQKYYLKTIQLFIGLESLFYYILLFDKQNETRLKGIYIGTISPLLTHGIVGALWEHTLSVVDILGMLF